MNKISLISLALSFIFTSGMMCSPGQSSETDATTEAAAGTQSDEQKDSSATEGNGDESKKKVTGKKRKRSRSKNKRKGTVNKNTGKGGNFTDEFNKTETKSEQQK